MGRKKSSGQVRKIKRGSSRTIETIHWFADSNKKIEIDYIHLIATVVI